MFAIRVTDSTPFPHVNDRAEVVKEALTGELITLEAVRGTITGIECDGLEIDGASFMAATPGVYRVKVTAGDDVRQLLVRVVDPSVLAAIPDPGLRVGYGRSSTPRLALRSICNTGPEAWDGTAAWFWDNRIKLADHGIVTAHNP